MPKIICIAGPTASGKTKLSVELSKALGGEVVSADSMQIYRGMDIGSAKPDMAERDGVPHHMLDILDPGEDYSVSRYVEEASRCVDGILGRGRLPIVTGGTGLYIDALINGTAFQERPEDGKLRARLRRYASIYGRPALHGRLESADPVQAGILHPNDEKRVIRALEVYYTTGGTISGHNSVKTKPRFDAIMIGLSFRDRQMLYDRINARVDDMLRKGLVDEAMRLWDLDPASTAIQAIGYKECLSGLGNNSEDQIRENIKRATRRYAKRQLTWFRRNEAIKWLYHDECPDIFQAALAYVHDNLIKNDNDLP